MTELEGDFDNSRPEESADALPKRFLYEALSLWVILGLTLSMVIVERWNPIPWRGYPSSLVLLGLTLWHKRHFGVELRLFQPVAGIRPAGVVALMAFMFAMVFALMVSACWPLAPGSSGGLSIMQSLHLFLLVPLAEELYFRGILLVHLRRLLSTTNAVVVCSLLFALLHLTFGALVVAGVISLFACILVLKSGALACAVQLHVTWNAVSQINHVDDAQTRWIWALSVAAVCFASAGH